MFHFQQKSKVANSINQLKGHRSKVMNIMSDSTKITGSHESLFTSKERLLSPLSSSSPTPDCPHIIPQVGFFDSAPESNQHLIEEGFALRACGENKTIEDGGVTVNFWMHPIEIPVGSSKT